MTPEALYDDLARWQWRRRGRAGLTVRKRLLANGAAADLDAWLLQLADVEDGHRVLDLGCGFGATLIAWAEARDVRGVGITLSGFQGARAGEELERRGLTDRIAIAVGSYDRPPPGPFDALVAVESLCHAPDLGVSLARVAEVAKPGARLVAVEDAAADARVRDDPDARELLARWSMDRLWTVDDWDRALAGGGWTVREAYDLTDRVPAVKRPVGSLRSGGARVMRSLTPSASGRRLWDAFLGGFALERLYARGLMRYRALVCERGGRS